MSIIQPWPKMTRTESDTLTPFLGPPPPTTLPACHPTPRLRREAPAIQPHPLCVFSWLACNSSFTIAHLGHLPIRRFLFFGSAAQPQVFLMRSKPVAAPGQGCGSSNQWLSNKRANRCRPRATEHAPCRGVMHPYVYVLKCFSESGMAHAVRRKTAYQSNPYTTHREAS